MLLKTIRSQEHIALPTEFTKNVFSRRQKKGLPNNSKTE